MMKKVKQAKSPEKVAFVVEIKNILNFPY